MFKITIEETRPIQKRVGKQWKIVGQEEKPFTQIDREGTYTADVYGYTPEVETVIDETRTVLAQKVDELDLKAVIAAINGLVE
jgi:hypothetical protein